MEACTPVWVESLVKYLPWLIRFLTPTPEAGRWTVSGGRFDWGGRLLKSNGGSQRYPQHGRQSCVECKSIRVLDCETYRSSRHESGV